MTLLALLAAAILWYDFGRRGLKDKRLWPSMAIALLGLILFAKGHPFLGLALAGGAAGWMHWLRRTPRRRPAARPFAGSMAQAEARALLGLPIDADREAILAAHRKLIARNHPDSGGTAGLAAQLNAARDLLLKSQLR